MIPLIARFIAIATLLILAGCKLTLPQVTSATIERYQSGQAMQPTELNNNQIQALSGWFSSHNSGWSSNVASYVPTLIVRAKHSNGDTSVINVLPSMVVVYNRTGQYVQQFSQSDLAAIHSIVEVK